MISTTVQEFVSDPVVQPWQRRFEHKLPGSRAFTVVWQDIATATPAAFFVAQHQFIKRTHYDPVVRSILRSGIDVDRRSAALRDVVWSTAVQHGHGAAVIIRSAAAAITAMNGDTGDDRLLIKAIYAERGRRNDRGALAHFRSSSIAVQRGIEHRYAHEEHDALLMLDAENAHAPADHGTGRVLP